MKLGATKIAFLLVGLSNFAAPMAAQAQSAASTTTDTVVSPGKVATAETTSASAKIISIDSKARTLLLKDTAGKTLKFEAGPEVRNFAQLKVGDMVHATYTEALSLELKKAGTSLQPDSDEVAGIRAAPGEKPGGVIGQAVTITANVVAIDAKTHTVSVRGPEGRTVDLLVNDPAQFKAVKVGDHVQARYTEALAIEVVPTP